MKQHKCCGPVEVVFHTVKQWMRVKCFLREDENKSFNLQQLLLIILYSICCIYLSVNYKEQPTVKLALITYKIMCVVIVVILQMKCELLNCEKIMLEWANKSKSFCIKKQWLHRRSGHQGQMFFWWANSCNENRREVLRKKMHGQGKRW